MDDNMVLQKLKELQLEHELLIGLYKQQMKIIQQRTGDDEWMKCDNCEIMEEDLHEHWIDGGDGTPTEHWWICRFCDLQLREGIPPGN
jgi:hypothetical protein